MLKPVVEDAPRLFAFAVCALLLSGNPIEARSASAEESTAETPVQLPDDTISNPVAYLYIDGEIDEWKELQDFGLDSMDMQGKGNETDWKRVWFSHNEKSLFIAIEKYHASDFKYSHSVYLDTDMDSTTGYKVCGVGADMMIQMHKVYIHAGKNQDYLWHPRGEAVVEENGALIEMDIPMSTLKSPEYTRVVFLADNAAHGGSQLDYYPDQTNTALPDGPWFHYDFRPKAAKVAPPRDPKSISNYTSSIKIDGSLHEWMGYTSFGIDGNDISDAAPYVDWIEAWMANDSQNLYMGIKLEASNDLNYGHTIYLDTDQNPKSGFRLRSLGADYLIQKDTIFRYVGNGTVFHWEPVTKLRMAKEGNQLEYLVPRMTLGNPFQIRVGFVGDNALFHHDQNDWYPDNISGQEESGPRYHVYYFSGPDLTSARQYFPGKR